MSETPMSWVSVRCLVCEKKFSEWVPDTPQNEKDASATVMTRLKQHLWSVHEEHGLSEGQIKNMRKSVQADVQEHAGDKLLVAKITRNRQTGEQPTESMEDQTQPQVQPLIIGSKGMNLEKQE